MQFEFGIMSDSLWTKFRFYLTVYSRGLAHALSMCWHHLAVTPVLTYVLIHSVGVDALMALSAGLLISLVAVMVVLGSSIHVTIQALQGMSGEVEHTKRMAVRTIKHIQEITRHIPEVAATMVADKDMGPLWKLAEEVEVGCGNPNCDCGKMNGSVLHPKTEETA